MQTLTFEYLSKIAAMTISMAKRITKNANFNSWIKKYIINATSHRYTHSTRTNKILFEFLWFLHFQDFYARRKNKQLIRIALCRTIYIINDQFFCSRLTRFTLNLVRSIRIFHGNIHWFPRRLSPNALDFFLFHTSHRFVVLREKIYTRCVKLHFTLAVI